MKAMKLVLTIAALVGLTTSGAMATPILADNFNSYNYGNLVPQGGWAAHSGTSGPVQVVDSLCYVNGIEAGKAIQLTNGSATEDVNLAAGSTMGAGDKWYAGFCVTVDGASPMVDPGDYFAHFKDSSTGFPAKIGIQAAVDGVSDYNIYLWQGGGDGAADGVAWSTDFMYGTCHRIVTSYDYDTGDVEMWIDPVCLAGPDGNPSVTYDGVYAGKAVLAYAFRQTNYSNPDPTMTIDNLNVATTWDEACAICVPEPATLSLLGFGALALLRRRR